MALTGAESGLFNVYSMAGLIVVVAVTSFPYVFVFTNSALDLVSSEMEDAANILGAGTLRTTFRVTLPLVLPAIVGGLIISFLEAIALFGAPALIALPARFHVVSTQLWQFFEYPVRVEQAAAYAMPLLLITLLHVLAAAQRARPARLHHGQRQGRRAAHHPARAVALGDARLCAVRLRARGVPADDRADAGGVRARPGAAASRSTISRCRTSTTSCSSRPRRRTPSSTPSCIPASRHSRRSALSLAIAYVVTRKLVPWSNVLAFLCMAPFVIPGIVLAIGFYAAYAPPPLALYGTATILILAYTTRFLPIAYTSSAAGMRSINPEMEEAVRILGGGRLHRDPPGAGAAAEAQPRGRLDPGVHPGDARALVRDLPGRPEHARHLGDAVRPVRGRQFRGAVRARHDPAGRDAGHRGDRLPRDRPRLHGALAHEQARRCAASRSATATSRRSRGSISTCSPGEFVSLLGPSGCGKTTTLRMIAGFIEPTAGTIEMDGQMLSSPSGALPPEKRQMSMIFQSYAVWPNMTVEQNVAFGLELRKLPREEVRRRVGRDARCRAHGASGGALSGRAVRRAAAARRARARDRDQAAGAAARRAAVEPRCQPARGDALRDPPAARRVPHHHGLRHPRPGRGDGHVGPHRGDEPGPHRAGRRPAHALQPAEDALRRGLHRPHQFHRGQLRRRRRRVRPVRGAARRARRRAGVRQGDRLGAAAEHAALARAARQRAAAGRGDDRRARLSGRILGLCGGAAPTARCGCASRRRRSRSIRSARAPGSRSTRSR